MKEQFDKLRKWADESVAPTADMKAALAALDIFEQVVADLHRIADAMEVMKLQHPSLVGGGFGGVFPAVGTHLEIK